MKKVISLILVLLVSFCFNHHVQAYAGFNITDEPIITLNDYTPYQINYEGDFAGLKFTSNTGDEVATVSESGLVTPKSDGIIIIHVYCKDGYDAKCNSHIYSAKYQIAILVNKDKTYETEFNKIKEEFDKIQKALNDSINTFDTSDLNLDFVEDLMTQTITFTDDEDNSVTGYFDNFGEDFIYYYMPKYETGLNESFITKYIDNKFEIQISRYQVQYDFSGRTYYFPGVKSIKKNININFAKGNEKDKQEVLEFAKKVPINNKSYINPEINKTDTIEDIITRQFTNSDTAKLMKEAGINSFIDFRRGDDSPMSAFAAGQIVLGKNGVYYTAQEFKIWSTLKLPRNKDLTIMENIKNYFEKNIKGNYDVRVEEVSDGIYRTYMTEKEQLSWFDKISNLIIPRVYAEETEKMVTFAVEEVDVPIEATTSVKTNNPKTSGPDLMVYVGVAIISGAGLGILLKKKKTNN